MINYYLGNDNGNVSLVWCKVCCEFYREQNNNNTKSIAIKGVSEAVADKYAQGTLTIKIANFSGHLGSLTHNTAVRQLSEMH